MKQMKMAAIAVLFLSILCCKTTETSTNNSSEVQTTTIKVLSDVTSFLDLVFVEGGSFSMGSNDGNPSEQPVHKVQVDSFYISKYEVTQSQWAEIMGASPTLNKGKGDKYPVYNVTWSDATDFCNNLSIKEGLTPCYSGTGAGIECDFSTNGYRLPTEAEWEYAARGGKKSQNYLYAGSNNADEAGWNSDNAEGMTHEVGLKAANELGIYDMSGNMWEWCGDWYGAKYYASSPSLNPTGPSSGIYRVLRGGGWGIFADGLRCSNRYYGAHRSDADCGFRCVRTR
jgi:sulfatase modifying factor 1